MCQCYLREYVVKLHPSQLSVGVKFSLHWKYLWTPQSSRVGLRQYLLLGPATNILDQSFCPHFLHIRYQLVFVFVQYDQFIFFNYILYIITYLLTILDFVFVQHDQFVIYFQLIFSSSWILYLSNMTNLYSISILSSHHLPELLIRKLDSKATQHKFDLGSWYETVAVLKRLSFITPLWSSKLKCVYETVAAFNKYL